MVLVLAHATCLRPNPCRTPWETQQWWTSLTAVWETPTSPPKTFLTSCTMVRRSRGSRACPSLTGGTFSTSQTSSYACSTSTERWGTQDGLSVYLPPDGEEYARSSSLLFFSSSVPQSHSQDEVFKPFCHAGSQASRQVHQSSRSAPRRLQPGPFETQIRPLSTAIEPLSHPVGWKVGRTSLLSPPSSASIVDPVIKWRVDGSESPPNELNAVLVHGPALKQTLALAK